MTRSILAACLVRPRWQSGPYRVEGPDQDAFTLGVEALSGLGTSLRAGTTLGLHRIHLVGPFGPESDWALSEALGLPELEVRRHPSHSAGVWGALAAAAHDEGSGGREAVLAADLADAGRDPAGDRVVRHGAGAAAFLLGGEPGLTVLRHGIRSHAPGRTPSLKPLVSGWIEGLGLSPAGGRGEVVLDVDEDAARWQATWEEVAPGVTVSIGEANPAQLGPAPTVRAAWRLWELARRLRSGETGVLVEASKGYTGCAGFRMDGPVRWRGDWGAEAPGLPVPGPRFLDRSADLHAVSQGAYVPHPRYVENLASRWRLVGERCGHCRALTFPSAARCRACGRSDSLRPEPLARTGLEVEAVTTISPGAQPTEFDGGVAAAGGYDVTVVALGSGARATVQVTDAVPGRLRVGDRVRLEVRRLYPMEGEWRYGLKALPESNGRSEKSEPTKPTSTPRRRRPVSSGAPTGPRASPRARGGRAAGRRPRP